MITRRLQTRRLRWAALALLLLAAYAVGAVGPRAHAQATNLLSNPSLENPYYGQGAPTRTAPQGWSLWVGAGAPDAFPHTDKTQVLDGDVSWNIKQGYTAFAAAGYQRVGGLTAGENVRATGYGWVYTCNNTETSCVIPDPPYRRSDPAAGASLRVGIDPNGGTDPNAPGVVWSAGSAPYDQWAELSVVAKAGGDAVTVFLYATQSAGLAINNVYWDKTSLVRTDEAAAGGGGAAPPPVSEAPFVTPQNVRPDGSIVHIVQEGDTLSSIAYAYSKYGATVASIAAINPGMKPTTRFLTLGQEVMILPPGSVDPVTGRLLSGGAPAPQTQPQPTSAAPAGHATPIPSPTAPGAGDAGAPPQPSATPSGAGDSLIPPTYAIVRAALMPFERGAMIWIEDTNQIYVLVNGEDALQGAYSVYLDTWREGMPETDPSLTPPAGLIQPARGFGQAWRTYPGVQDALGWATGDEQGYTALVVRDNGSVILNGPDKRVYRLLTGGTWEVVDKFLEDADSAETAPTDAAAPTATPTTENVG